MLYNAVIQKENVGLNINDIERLKDFAKAMGHSILAEQTNDTNVSLHKLESCFISAIGEYKREVKDYFALVGDIKFIYLYTDKGYVATTINGQYPFYFVDDGVFKSYAKSITGEFMQCYTSLSHMWEYEMPYIILFVNSLSNVTDIAGTDKGVAITYRNPANFQCVLSVRFNHRYMVIKGKDDERGISFKNAMERGSRVAKWKFWNEVRKGA